jgi:hypothetical protein
LSKEIDGLAMWIRPFLWPDPFFEEEALLVGETVLLSFFYLPGDCNGNKFLL